MLHAKPSSAPAKETSREGVLGYLQGPRDAAVTLETAPVLEVPTALQRTGSKATSQLLDEHPVAAVCRGPFEEVAGEQLAATVDQLLLAYNVQEADAWAPIVKRLAHEAAGMLSPGKAVAYGNLDPRFYIKVKKVPGVGKPEDSCTIDGAVCRKNLAHKRMCRHFKDPKILMVAKNLEFNRAQSRLTSLEGMTKQEEEDGLKEQVDKLVALGPNVVLVEKSVARKAQDELLERGISLALNMKRPVLDFIARCTGTEVAPSAEVATAKNLASCREFLVEDTYPAPPRPTLSCISSASSMTSTTSFTPPQPNLHAKHETLKTLAAAAERSRPSGPAGQAGQQAEASEMAASQLAAEHVPVLIPKSSFGQHSHPSPSAKADPSKQPGLPKHDATAVPHAPSAAQQGSLAGKPSPAASSQASGQPQLVGLQNGSKTEASKGATAARTLMYFKGCPEALGCTVLLKGAPRNVLASVKKVTEFAVYAAYRNRLETAFLADELASAIPTASDCASRPASPKCAAKQAGSAFATPARSAAGTPQKHTPDSHSANPGSAEHLQITQPDGQTALASRSADQSICAPSQEEPAMKSGAPSLMSSLMASSAPGHKMQEEPQFSRAVSSALQDMGQSTPSKQEAQHKEARSAAMLSSSPPFREGRTSPHEGKQEHTLLEGDEGGLDLIDINKAELAKHARRVVQRSAHMAAADRGHGLLVSLSAHVTVGAAEWTGNDPHDFAFDEEAMDAQEEAKAEDASSLRPSPGISRAHHTANGAHSRQSSTDSVQQEKALRTLVLSDAEDGPEKLERQAEAGELLGLQRLYVCTALSNQPNGGLAEPLKVKRIDYYQRTDQALSQLLSPASVEAHGGEVTTYLHGDGLLTLRMARLPEGQGLPGADANQIWFWLRPRQASLELLGAARRVPLSRDAAAMSLGHFLEVSFGAHHLSVGSRPLHAGYARYFGRGNAVACFLWERVGPVQIDMPPQNVLYYVPAQRAWVKSEVEELIEEANRIFGAIDAALKATEEVAATGALLTQQGEPAPSAATSQGVASPGSSQSADPSDKLYGSSPEKAAKAQPAGASPPKENSMAGPQDEQAAVPDLSNHKSTAADSAGDKAGPKAGFLSHLRTALMAEVSGLVENIQDVCALIRADATDLANPAPSDAPHKQANEEEELQGLSNEDLLQAIWRINSLQRSLSIMALTWASCLHDAAAAALPAKQRPRLLTSVNSRTFNGAGAGVPQRPGGLPMHHAHSHSAPAELDVRVLLANAAKSAPGSPKAASSAIKLDSPFATDEDVKLGKDQQDPSATVAQLAAPSDASPEAAVVRNLSQLLHIVSGELSGDHVAGTPRGLEAAAMSAADREAIGHLARTMGSQDKLEASPDHASSNPSSAPALPKCLSTGQPGSAPSNEDAGSVLSAPDAADGQRPGPGQRAYSATELPRANSHSRVSRYMSMIEARNMMISMPSWERPILRHNSTDLVLRFLNRHHHRVRAPRSASPQQRGPDAAPSDSENSSDSEDDAELDPPASLPNRVPLHTRPASLEVSTPSQRLSPPRRQSPPGSPTRRSLERAGSGPQRPSPLGDTSRAALAASAMDGYDKSLAPSGDPPLSISTGSVDLPEINLSNVRSNLSKGAGGALSPNGVLSPRAQARQEDFQGGSQPAEGLRHEHVHQPELASAVKSTPGMPAEAELPPMTPAEAQEMERVLAREPSDVLGHFNSDMWLKALRQSRDLDNESPGPPPDSVPHVPSLESVSEAGPPALSSRPPSPAPSAGLPPAAGSTSEEARSRVSSLPPAVLRRAQQLPGAIPLPDGHQVELQHRALLQPGVDERIVVVRDDEPTSLLAYALSSREHHQFLEEVRLHVLHNGPKPGGQMLGRATLASRSSTDLAAHDEAAPFAASVTGREESASSAGAASAADAADAKGAEEPGKARKEGTLNGAVSELEPEWMMLTWPRPMHFEHTAVDDHPGLSASRTKLSVTVWFPAQFAELRRICLSACGGEAAFCASLSRCHRWEPRGGKSNSFFAKTRDDRFIVKQLSAAERKSFQELAPNFFAYLGRAMRCGQPTCLAKIMGVFTVRVESAKPMDLLVMENVFYERSLAPVYDLKGSERARWCKDDPADPTTVLLDENLKRDILSAPLLVEPAAHEALMKALWADTAFLAGQGVMDYSLLVGVDSPNGALVVGIIDFLRQYTWDKALERWVKSVGLGQDRGKAPTIQSPRDYCKRFRGAMAGYFTCVPAEGDVPAPLDVAADLTE